VTLRLGLAQGLVPRDPRAVTPALARELAGLGVRAVVTHLVGPPRELMAGGEATRVREVLAAEGIAVVQATGYTPCLVHPDPERRRIDLARLRDALLAARELGSAMVISGCGSLHPSHHYGPCADNHGEAARERLVSSLVAAAPWAEEAGVVLALECHVLTTLDTPERVRELLDRVDSPWVRANFDPVNFVGDLGALYDTGALLRRVFDALEPHLAPCAHVKDVVALPELVLHLSEVPPGQGLFDLDAMFAACARLPDGAALVVEHLDRDASIEALAYVRRRATAAGLQLE
jgi:sugar phosphate isomerase/epimerase